MRIFTSSKIRTSARLRESNRLDEFTAKQLSAENTPEIKQRARTQGMAAVFQGVDKNGDVLFRTNSGTTKGVFWNQRIRFTELPEVLAIRADQGAKRKARELQQSTPDPSEYDVQGKPAVPQDAEGQVAKPTTPQQAGQEQGQEDQEKSNTSQPVKQNTDPSELTDSQLINLLQAGEVMLHCDCPSFLYQGWTYMSWNMEYGVVPENRPPRVRNPNLRGATCKHCELMLTVLPFNIQRILQAYRQKGIL